MKVRPRLIFIILFSTMLIWLINLIWYKPFFINLYFERLFVEYGLRHPEILTSARTLEKYGFTAHNRELNNISLEYRLETFEKITKAFEMLRSYKRNKLDQEEQLSHDVLDFYLEKIIFKQQFFQHEIPLNHLDGLQATLPTFLIENQKVENLQDAEHYLDRISKISEKVYQYIQTIMLKDEGDKPPAFVFEYMIAQIDTFLTNDIEDNLLISDFKRKISSANLINPDAKSELLYNLRLEIGDNVYPAFKELRIKLEVEREHASDQVGIWQYNDGDAYYYLLLNESLTLDTSMYDLEEGAIAEIERLHKKAADKLNVSKESVKEELQKLTSKASSNDNKDSFIHLKKNLIGVLEKTGFTSVNEGIILKNTMAFNARHKLTQYNASSLDGHRKATLLISNPLLSFVPDYMLKGLALAEVFPGNHFMSENTRLTAQLPSIRKIINFNAYQQGWKYYVLEISPQLKFTDSLLEEIGCIQWQLLYASLAVADLRIHQNMISREEAIDFVISETGLPEQLVIPYIDKVIVKPAYAPAYLVGFNAFKRLNHVLIPKNGDVSTQKFVSNIPKIANYGPVPIKFFSQLKLNDSSTKQFLAGSSTK